MMLRPSGTLLIACALLVGCSKEKKDKLADTAPAKAVAKVLDKAAIPADSPWASPAACEAALKQKRSAPAPDKTFPRVATWNVRYFPDSAEHGPAERPTDVNWLACAIALLDVDVLAVQEFKSNAAAKAAASDLVRKLNAQSGRSYRLELARCEPADVQHPGLLYDEKRVKARGFRDMPELNPDSKCTNSASPGFAAHLGFVGGPQLEVIVMHSYAGDLMKSHAKREQSLAALERTLAKMERAAPGRQVVVLGDLNTSGCDDCRPAIDSAAETRALSERVGRFTPPLRLVASSEPCTFLGSEPPTLLDHFLVSSRLEVARATVSGPCGVSHCNPFFPKPDAEKVLSDHCPVVVELGSPPG